MPAVLFEGGTFRPIFSSGVMDALLDEGVMFPYCIGVSAGSADAASYISGQRGRNLESLELYRNDKRYLSRRNYFKEGSAFGVQFVFRDIPNIHLPFDMEAFKAYEGQFLIVATDAETGKVHYFTQEDVDEDYEVFHATCALPHILPPASINGREYFDGGLSNPIPIDKVLEDGNDKVLIVLTRTKDYKKACGKKDIVAARQIEKKYPQIARALVNRYRKYNHSLEVCRQLEEQGRAVVIRPDIPLESLEKDVDVLRSSWQCGYDKAIERMDEIKALFS
jgi:predicted patatin/cPLA2 family phospholipase